MKFDRLNGLRFWQIWITPEAAWNLNDLVTFNDISSSTVYSGSNPVCPPDGDKHHYDHRTGTRSTMFSVPLKDFVLVAWFSWSTES